MALLMQIPQFAPLNIPAPQPARQHTGGLMGSIMQAGGRPAAAIPGAPAGAAAPAAAAGGAGGMPISPEMLAQIVSSLGMFL